MVQSRKNPIDVRRKVKQTYSSAIGGGAIEGKPVFPHFANAKVASCGYLVSATRMAFLRRNHNDLPKFTGDFGKNLKALRIKSVVVRYEKLQDFAPLCNPL